jgi:hypothetical protein
LCHDKVKATAFNKILATELSVNKFIIQDFGVLFSKKKAHYVTDEFLPDFGISEFTTTNFVKVKAFGIGNAIRGEQYRHPKKGIRRPDFLLCDDIDNYKNTKNTALIDKDVSFLQQEAFGGMASYGQIVVLGNVIRVDGRNVRIKANYRDNPKWKMFSNFIY